MSEELLAIVDKIDAQAKCLEGYAEQDGHSSKAPASIYHWQATHFRDIATELRKALAGSVVVPSGHTDTEGEAMQLFDHLNCPLCAGSGHVEDAEALGSLIVRLLVALDDVEMPDGSGQMGMPASVEDAAGDLAAAIQWDGERPTPTSETDQLGGVGV